MDVVGKQGSIAIKLAIKSASIRIDEQLPRIAALAICWIPRAVDAVTVALAGNYAGQVCVPDVIVLLLQLNASLLTFAIDEAEFDLLCDMRK